MNAPDKLTGEIYFAGRLRALRRDRGLTQEALASACGLDRSYISLIELGKKSPTLRVIFKVSSALRCDPSSLLKGGGPEVE